MNTKPNQSKYYFLTFLFMVFGQLTMTAQNPENIPNNNPDNYEEAWAIWRGFKHQWTYNHRLNRLGSYVDNQAFMGFPHEATLNHTSATGVGGDVGVYESHYTLIAANDVKVKSGKTAIKFVGKEGEFHSLNKQVLINAPPEMQAQEQYTVLLNGFDILSEGRANKLQTFRLGVSDATYLPATNQIRFSVNTSLLVRCKSIECRRFSNKFNYIIKAHYVILAASEKALNTVEKNASVVYNWNKNDAIDYKTKDFVAKGVGQNKYQTAALAFKNIHLNLDREHWMLEWHSVINPENYDAQNGTFAYNLDLLFKQWSSSMKKASANPKKSKFSMKRAGWATIDATVCLLQFADAQVVNNSHKDVFKWDGHNLPAKTAASVKSNVIAFDAKTFTHNGKVAFDLQKQVKEQELDTLYEKYSADLNLSKTAKKEIKQQKKTFKRRAKSKSRNVK